MFAATPSMKHVVVPALAQLGGEPGGRRFEQLGAQFGREPGRRRGACERSVGDVGGQPGRLARAPGLGALQVVDGRQRAEFAVEGRLALRRPWSRVGRTTGRPAAIRSIDLDLDDVAGHDDRRAGRRAGEDDVAGLEREVLGEVGDELREREDAARRWCRPGRSSPLTQVRTRRAAGSTVRASMSVGAERRVAVAALGADVRALVVRAQVVESEVVRGGDPARRATRRPRGRRDGRRCRSRARSRPRRRAARCRPGVRRCRRMPPTELDGLKK